MNPYQSIEWKDNAIRMIDQRLIPYEIKYVDVRNYHELAASIRDMLIRGAPAIGAAAGYGMVLAANQFRSSSRETFLKEMESAAEVIRAARPTAVNLFYAVDRVMKRIESKKTASVDEICQNILEEAHAIAEEDIDACRRIGENAMQVVPDTATFIHHCNTGALATVGIGSALGVIRTAHEKGKKVFVYVDETRPRLQGARLTSWELKQLGIPHAVIVDGASGHIMRTRKVDLVTVGCDRIAANGDFANKVGTYNLGIAAKAHNVPFYSVGPTSTIDLSIPDGDHINIEERPADEITHIGKEQITPDGVQVVNPSFDVTPNKYLTGIITEEGIAYPPFTESLALMVKRARERREKSAR